MDGKGEKIQCVGCGADAEATARFCQHCGIDLDAQRPRGSNAVRIVTVGRDADNDVVLDRPVVSGRHILLTVTGTRMTVQDLKTTNGTFIGAPDRRVEGIQTVTAGDVLYFGGYRVTLKRLLAQAGIDQTAERVYRPGPRPLVMGRDPECDVVLDHPEVDGRHVQVTVGRDGLLLEVGAGARPVRVNQVSVRRQQLVVGDKVHIGPFLFEYRPEGWVHVLTGRQIFLELQDVSVVVHKDHETRRKTLLDRLSVAFYPGELIALMGVAGSGKSTLIGAAAGRRAPDYGQVLVNGRDLYAHFDQFRHELGYVPQDDIFHRDLTVGQALTYAARMRLDACYSESGLLMRVREVLEQLAMFDANPDIMDVRLSQVSGGQRRRVNIAVELLSDPNLFFLDEPLSGLSSEDALAVMVLLRRLADSGKTVVLSLHQPSAELYRMLDNVLYLHQGGRMVYYGPAAPDAFLFTQAHGAEPSADPDAVLRSLGSKPARFWQQAYRGSAYAREFVLARKHQLAARPPGALPEARKLIGGWAQWCTLLSRNARVKLNDTLNTAILLAQAPVIAMLIALVFSDRGTVPAYQNLPTTLYLMVISAIWFGCSNAARDICGEWPVFRRERLYHLHLLPYLSARLALACLIGLVQVVILTAVVYPTCGFRGPPEQLALRLWLTCSAGVCLGLLVSAFAAPFKKSNEVAVGLIPLVLLPMVIMGGVIQPHRDMNTLAQGVAALTVTRWSFESNLAAEAKHHHDVVPMVSPDGTPTEQAVSTLILDRFFEPGSASVQRGILVVLSFCLALILVTLGYLRLRDGS